MEISVINYVKNMALAIKIVEISISRHKIRTNFIFIPHSREGVSLPGVSSLSSVQLTFQTQLNPQSSIGDPKRKIN